MHVALQVLSYREPELTPTLDEWSKQRVPHYVERIDYQAALTPRSEIRSHRGNPRGSTEGNRVVRGSRRAKTAKSPDQPIRAAMAEQAEAHPVFEMLETPPGKLSARNAAHAAAVKAGADAIVSVDADAPPLREGVLAALVRPLERREGVVAVNSTPISTRTPQGAVSAPGVVIDAAATVEDLLFPHLHGQGASISRAGWQAAGPFDTDLDETDAEAVRAEEELRFYWRLRPLGRVARAGGAVVYNDPRRHYCRFVPSLAPEGYCEERGATTFYPE